MKSASRKLSYMRRDEAYSLDIIGIWTTVGSLEESSRQQREKERDEEFEEDVA